MRRRTFLKGTVVTAGAAMLGCGDDGGDTGEGTTTAGEDAGTDGDGTTGGGEDGGDTTQDDGLLFDAAYFPQSVASGDPKAASVVLWTRAVDAGSDGDLALELHVATDEAFVQRVELSAEASQLTATAAHDHCVKVKLQALEAGTFYWYRFIYTAGDGTLYTSKKGRTKTAPAAGDDVKVRFAYASCQDFNGHYYNTYRRLMQLDDLDFVVHLGDYIYETTGNPSFQDATEGRRIELTDTDGAIPFQNEVGTWYAARTLGNYREVYQQYRSDLILQEVHERFPFVIIWDDHEFTDDAHGFTATYHGGEENEEDLSRRQAASQAWFEFMPVDYMAGDDYEYDPGVGFPDDIKIWRDLVFGKNMHLVLTDLRTRRNDHLIPEDAFHGAVNMTQAELEASLGEVPDLAIPYVDIEAYEGGIYAEFLKASAEAGEYPVDDVKGNISVFFINGAIAAATEAGGSPPVAIEDTDGLDRGFAWHQLGKGAKYVNVGARYLVVKDTYDVWSKARYILSKGESEQMMGDDQRAWFLDTMKGSQSTWKIWGNEFCLLQLIADVSNIDSLPPELKARFYVTVDDWSGMPNRRDELLAELGKLDNVVALTGDIHAFFAGVPTSRADGQSKVIELVTAGISSNSLRTLLVRTATASKTLPPTAAALAYGIGSVLVDPLLKPNVDLAHASVESQGFAVVEVDSQGLDAWFHGILEEHVATDLGDTLEDKFVVDHFRVDAGSKALQKEVEGALKTWDPDAFDWV